jgi:uncharacterized membrane protein
MSTGGPDEGDGERRIAELTRRVGELEGRVAGLEVWAAQSQAYARAAWSQQAHASGGPLYPGSSPIPDRSWGQAWAAGPRNEPRPAAPQLSRPQAAQEAQAPHAAPAQQAPHAPQPPQAPKAPVAAAAAQTQQQPTAWAPYRPQARGGPRPSLAEELGVSLGSLRDLESRLTGRLLAWVGGAAVVLGAVFFLSLAFSRGWIGPEARVGLGLALGEGLIGSGALLFGRRQAQLAHVLLASGLGVVSLALSAGTRLYGLYPPEAALAGSFLTAMVAAAIAIRVNSETVAIYGLLAVAAAPPIMGAGATVVTIVFLGSTIVGTTVIALARAWRWLPPIAFAITAPQLLFWLSSGPDAAAAVAAIGAYWFLHAVAAAADGLHPAQPEAETRGEALLVANSTLALGGGLFVLSGGLLAWQGAFVAALAVSHLVLGGYCLWRRGEKDTFALLVTGIGIALAAFAVERQFDGPAVPIGWAIEAVVLAAIFGPRRNVYAGWAAVVLAGLALAHLAWYEYPGVDWSLAGGSGRGSLAFVDPAGLTLACLLAACLIGGWLSRDRAVRSALAIVGMLTVAYALPYELSGTALVAGWAAGAVALLALFGPRKNSYATSAEALLALLAVVHLGSFEYPGLQWSLAGRAGSGPFAFVDSSGLTLACLLAACVAGGWLSRSREVRNGLTVAGLLAIAYSLPYEVSGAALVAAWAGEAVVLVALFGVRRYPYGAAAAALLAGLAVLHLCSYDYPASAWLAAGRTGLGAFAFADAAGLSLAALLLAAFLAGWLSRDHSARCGLATAGLLAVAYSLPYELSGLALVAGWALLVPFSVGAEGLLDLLPGVPAERREQRRIPIVAMNQVHWPDSPLLAAITGVCLAVVHLIAYDLPLSSSATFAHPAVPFTDAATASFAIGVAAFIAAALITARPDLRAGLILLAAGLVAYCCFFELALAFAIVAWCILAAALVVLSPYDRFGRWAYVAGAATLVAIAAAGALGVVAPPDRLVVQDVVSRTGFWFAIDSILAIGAVAGALVFGGRLLPLERSARTALALTAAAGLVYLASVVLVDFFQGRVGGATPLEELQKQAQVCVSILWGLIGMTVFLAGVLGWRQVVRESGLALLTLATIKVFLFDLSYLDVAYRVLSLMGLGLLLLVGAYAYQSLRPHRAADAPGAGAEVGAEQTGE